MGEDQLFLRPALSDDLLQMLPAVVGAQQPRHVAELQAIQVGITLFSTLAGVFGGKPDFSRAFAAMSLAAITCTPSASAAGSGSRSSPR